MNQSSVPSINVNIYQFLFLIEIFFRELIIDLLSKHEGPLWYKARLPGDVLNKYREGLNYERNIKSLNFIPHHPLYYIDFSDLNKILVRDDNWNLVFKNIFGPQKTSIESYFTDLEPIRNKIAHNRMVTELDLNIVEIIYNKIRTTLSSPRFDLLLSKLTKTNDIHEEIKKVAIELENIHKTCKEFKEIKKFEMCTRIKREWWFDETYLGHSNHEIIDFILLLEEYKKLTRKRGAGYIIEKWLNEVKFDNKYEKAQLSLSKIVVKEI